MCSVALRAADGHDDIARAGRVDRHRSVHRHRVDHQTLVAGTPPTVTEMDCAAVKPAPKIVTSAAAAPGAPDGSAVFGVMLMTASAGTAVRERAGGGRLQRIRRDRDVDRQLRRRRSDGRAGGDGRVADHGHVGGRQRAERHRRAGLEIRPGDRDGVPPEVGPVFGETLLSVGPGNTYVNACESVADWLSCS